MEKTSILLLMYFLGIVLSMNLIFWLTLKHINEMEDRIIKEIKNIKKS